jgi:uncharacterized protein (DUF58 family)
MLDLQDKAFLKALRMLRIVTRRFFRGQKVGQRRSAQRGASVEFKDYKDYYAGDDPRFIDWNVYGRFDKLLVKLFHNEEDLQVYVLLDTSESMLHGTPSKIDHARKLAAAISYLAAAGMDRSRIVTFSTGLREASGGASRPGHVFNHFRFLEKAQLGGGSELAKTVDEFILKNKRRGAVFIVSDFFTPDAIEEAARKLRYHKYEVFLVQVLAEDEIVPNLAGLYKLVDSEDGTEREVFIDRESLDVYRQVLEEFTGGLEAFAHKNGMTYVKSATGTPFESTIMQFFRGVRVGEREGA